MAGKLWWLICKDLTTEWRARRAWPAMLLLGIVVALLLTARLEGNAGPQPGVVATLYWLAVFFAGVLALDRSFAVEREESCWEGLLLYPISPSTIYLAKLAANTLALFLLQCVLVPVFAVLTGMPLSAHPCPMALLALLGSLGIAAVGTLLSALTVGIRQTAGLLGLLTLPLLVPVVFSASEAMRLLAANDLGLAWWQAVQLLAAFAIVFITAAVVLFEFVIED